MNAPLPTLVEVLDQAASVIERDGHCQGAMYDLPPNLADCDDEPPPACPVDVLGALFVAAGLHPNDLLGEPSTLTTADRRERRELAVRAAAALADHLHVLLPGDDPSDASFLMSRLGFGWNDQTPAAVVTDALRATAKAVS